MFQKLTRIGVADGSGVGWLQVFHLYRGSWRRYCAAGNFLKASVRTIITFPRYIRGRRYRPVRVGFIVRGLATSARSWARFTDGSRQRFLANSCVLLKRRGLLRSKYVYVPHTRLIRRSQYRLLFPTQY